MNISETRKGEWYIFGGGVLWAFFPIVTIVTFAGLSPMASLAWGTLLAAVFFGATVILKGRQRELLKREIYPPIFLIAFFIGWLFYGLYFSGLKFTTAGNAGIIALMEIFFSYLLFNVWKKEKFSLAHSVGAVLMLLAAAIILFPKQDWAFHGGDFLVLAASACAPFGNFYQQKLRQAVSSETILFLRSLLAFPVFFLLAAIFGAGASWGAVRGAAWLLLFNGFLILGLSKIFWIEGIHRISVTKSNALSAVTPALTLLLAYIFLRQNPTVWQLLALVPMALGVWLLT